MPKPPRRNPPCRVSVRPANLSTEETDIRLRKALDIVIDEILSQDEKRGKPDQGQNASAV
jgi:hypothetical protein